MSLPPSDVRDAPAEQFEIDRDDIRPPQSELVENLGPPLIHQTLALYRALRTLLIAG